MAIQLGTETQKRLGPDSPLPSSRYVYKKAGFRLVHKRPHHSFGHDLIGETWALKL